MLKLRIIAVSLMMLLFIPLVSVPVQVKADSPISAFARLAGTSGPVLTAVGTCVLKIIIDKTYAVVTASLKEVTAVLKAKVESNTWSDNYAKAKADNAANKLSMKDDCWVPMEKAAIAVILNVLTQETVAWINGGMNGSPMFLQDPAKAMNDLWTSAVGNFSDGILKGVSNDFAKALLKDTLNQLHKTFENDMKSNLKKALPQGITPINFQAKFSTGGWDALTMAILPQNNAVGTKKMMDKRVAAVVNGFSWSPLDDLKKTLQTGFLDQKECVDPAGMKKPYVVSPKGSLADQNKNQSGIPVCYKEKTVTPGQSVMDKLNSSLHVTQDTLVNSTQLDASITAIFDALMGQFIDKGLGALGGDDKNNNNNNNNGNGNGNEPYNGNSDPLPPQQTVSGNASGGSLCGVGNASDWHTAFPTFKLETDLESKRAPQDIYTIERPGSGKQPQLLYKKGDIVEPGLIDREKQLENVLLSQNNVLQWIENAIYMLDMCIPGPSAVNNPDIKDTIYGKIMQDYAYPGNAVDQINEIYNAKFLSEHFGVKFFPSDKIKSPSQAMAIMKTLISRYYDAMVFEYKNVNRIDMYPKYLQFWNKIDYYKQQILDNNAKIVLMNGTIATLQKISSRVSTWQQGGFGSDELKAKAFAKIQGEFDALIPDLDVSPYIGNPGVLNSLRANIANQQAQNAGGASGH